MNIITLYRQTSESLKSVRLHTLLKINYRYFFVVVVARECLFDVAIELNQSGYKNGRDGERRG